MTCQPVVLVVGQSNLAQVYWLVSDASSRGILVRVRTGLADRVAELIALTPQDQDVPDKQAAAQAVQLNITGERPTIHFGDRRAGDIGNPRAENAARRAWIASNVSGRK